MATYTFVYDSRKTKTVVLNSLSERVDGAYADIQVFQKCCGSLAYLSLFLLPEFELADKSTISIEQVCMSTPGMFKYDMHKLLTNLGMIACGNCDSDCVKTILNITTLYECLKFLGVHPVTWTRVLLCNYLSLKGYNLKMDAMLQVSTYDKLIQIFNMEAFTGERQKHNS